ncbi:hypothetical protein FEM48_Zijuj08G0122600 [Ziziphus jujuba var. spinosa]|uniref:Phosphatidylinositol 3,4,5-trisphosphate 3-phosphatase and protein-tyrosine-phosphatase PTEN2A-like n=1 Tax=Ziziphus jujuba var. spinosa TaxID=714518 RepID=A0A978UZ18_ZIZJJ|nr:hypothetical protein FEM48_Zijuj08G0122600 [Ziziphus jujuba var. spinosa]
MDVESTNKSSQDAAIAESTYKSSQDAAIAESTNKSSQDAAIAESPNKSSQDAAIAESTNKSSQNPAKAVDVQHSDSAVPGKDSNNANNASSMLSASGISTWAMKFSQSLGAGQESSQTGNAGVSAFARFTSRFGSQTPYSSGHSPDEGVKDAKTESQSGVLESLTKGLVDTSQSVVKAMQVKARHMVSQNKRRYQEGGFDLDMTYITENIIAMGFPAGSITSGIFGYLEGFYRNHMEEVIKFFETHHKGKYKVYNLCSERLYDASLFQGKVASFPFEDHNCPPIDLIRSFCQSSYSWLKEDIQNVVVVHCKAGMARTGLMICSLLLFLKLFPTAEEAMEYYNQKRCVDGKALVLPSQIRYVKYFERTLTYFNGETQPCRRCMLRGFRLHRCPYWMRPSITISDHNGILFSTKKHPKTKDLMPQDFWIKAPKKGIVVFALPGEPGLTELAGDFKIHFQESQGDFYWFLDYHFPLISFLLLRKFPSPGFKLEIVMIDYNGTLPTGSKSDSSKKKSDGSSSNVPDSSDGIKANPSKGKAPHSEDNDDVFSDSEGEQTEASKKQPTRVSSGAEPAGLEHASNTIAEEIGNLAHGTDQLTISSKKNLQNNALQQPNVDGAKAPGLGHEKPNLDSGGVNDIKAIAADASVFTFGDEEDFDSE